MEPEVKEFLKRIMLSIFFGFTWMMINIIAGIKYNYAFVEGGITMGNVIFYTWFLVSFGLLLFFFRRLWRKPLE